MGKENRGISPTPAVASGGETGSKACYCALYTQVLKQWKVSEAIRKALPGGEGEVFYPCREMWWHGSEKSLGKTVFRPLFPGYVFIRSQMDRVALHGLVLRARWEIFSFVKELGVSPGWAAADDAFGDTTGIIDLADEEAEFFDFLLGFRYDADLDRRREEAAAEGEFYRPAQTPRADGQGTENTDAATGLADEEKAMAAELRRRKKQAPQKGVVQMSFGYMEGGKYIVMDGPLKGHESRIRKYIAKDRKACLDIGLGGKDAKVGLTLLGKKVWFPKDKGSPDILQDGTVVDTQELARIMGGGIRSGRKRK